MENKKKAFTLVELTVVIIIIVILSTIGLSSFRNYPKQARDSKRISDLNKINKILQIEQGKTGEYPTPDSFPNGIVYSGTNLGNGWIDGVLGTGVIKKIGKIDLPLDPNTKKPYRYFVKDDKTSFKLVAYLEDGNEYPVGDWNVKSNYSLNIDFGGRISFDLSDACDGKTSGSIVYADGTENGKGMTCNHDIAICKGDKEGIIIQACNLGATSIDKNSPHSCGNHYQWGRNKGFPYYDNEEIKTELEINLTRIIDYNPELDTYGFVAIKNTSGPIDWLETSNDTLWDSDGNRKGPCQHGYHVPTKNEIDDFKNYGKLNLDIIKNKLFFPDLSDSGLKSNIRQRWGVVQGGNNNEYWTSSIDLNSTESPKKSHIFSFSNGICNNCTQRRDYGLPIRCFKDK